MNIYKFEYSLHYDEKHQHISFEANTQKDAERLLMKWVCQPHYYLWKVWENGVLIFE